MTLSVSVAARFRLRQPMLAHGRRWLSSTPVSSVDSSVVVGFIGLGNMGLPMALNLANAGHSVLAFDTDRGALTTAERAGILPAKDVSEIGAGDRCSVIFTMLPGCPAVHAVSSALLLAEHSSPKVFVDCSTVHPSTSRKWNEDMVAKGHKRIDAPVSGGVKGATDGTLTFMVGCQDSTALRRVTPYLDCMGRRTIPCGGPGAGAATKLCNNLALAAQMIGICEAMNLGEALQVDPVVLADVMNTSTAASWSCQVNNPHPRVAVAKGGTTPAANDYRGGFGTALMLKDLGLALNAGAQVGVSMPLGSTCKELYQLADAHGLGGKDFGVMLQFLRGSGKLE